MIYILLMSLPLLGQWLWGGRGSVICTIAALVYVIGVPYYSFQSMMVPLPGDMEISGVEAQPEKVSPGVGLLFLSMVVPHVVAVLAGAALAILWGMIQLMIGTWRADAPDNPQSSPSLANVSSSWQHVAQMFLFTALVVTLLAAVFVIAV